MKRILIVDDDRTLRAILKRNLEDQGYSVEEVNSAIEALKLFQSDPPDLVVSDVMMPEMDGFEFCRRLRSDPQGKLVPFIFLSSRGELDVRIAGHSIGADDYLLKPFEPRELVAKIEAQLERSRRIHSEMIRLMQMASRVPTLNQKPYGQTVEAESKEYPVSRPWSDSSEEDEKTEDEETATPEPLPLTPAEARVFWEVIQGYTNKQIAANLFISPRTVQTHLRHILSKLNVENRSQLVRFAFENGYKPPAEQ